MTDEIPEREKIERELTALGEKYVGLHKEPGNPGKVRCPSNLAWLEGTKAWMPGEIWDKSGLAKFDVCFK